MQEYMVGRWEQDDPVGPQSELEELGNILLGSIRDGVFAYKWGVSEGSEGTQHKPPAGKNTLGYILQSASQALDVSAGGRLTGQPLTAFVEGVL